MNIGIDLILVDLGNVLFRSMPVDTLVRSFWGESVGDRVVTAFVYYHSQMMNGELSENKFVENLAELMQQDVNAIRSVEKHITVTLNYTLIGMLRLLKALYPLEIGIVSDIDPITFRVFRNTLFCFDDLFKEQYLFLSFNMRKSKYRDGRACFAHVIKQLDMPPQRVLFIDDNRINVENAVQVGIPTIHFDRDGVSGLDQLARLLYADTGRSSECTCY